MNALTQELQQLKQRNESLVRDPGRLRIAIQKSGRLQQDSLALLLSLGLDFPAPNRQLAVPCNSADVDLISLRQSDIPKYIEQGTVDFGIVGLNVLLETTPNVQVLNQLGFGTCKLVIALPETTDATDINQLQGKRIATSYPNSLQRWLDDNNIFAKIITMSGSVEVAPELGIADAVCDLTQTGTTLKAHNLAPLATVYESEAVLITSLDTNKLQTEYMNTYFNSLP